MFENTIKVDGHVTLKKKVAKSASKPRTVSFEGGGDDVTIDRVIQCTLQIGGFCIEVPSTQPEKQKIKPTFRTPCNFFCIGRLCEEYQDVKAETPRQRGGVQTMLT